jgi:hypothetical protein
MEGTLPANPARAGKIQLVPLTPTLSRKGARERGAPEPSGFDFFKVLFVKGIGQDVRLGVKPFFDRLLAWLIGPQGFIQHVLLENRGASHCDSLPPRGNQLE